MSRSKSLLALIVLPVVLLVGLLSVGAASARSTGGAQRDSLAIPTITISGFVYKVPASVPPGARIKVVDNDNVTHTVTSNTAGKFNVSVPPHSTRYFKAPAKGKYGFHCTFHSGMKGTLHVG